jgi:hypothetical protein
MLGFGLLCPLTRYSKHPFPCCPPFSPYLRCISTEHPSEKETLIFSPSLLKLERAPKDVQDKIWSEILAFALYVNVGPVYEADIRATAIKDWRRTLLFVSKTFHVSDECNRSTRQAVLIILETRSAPLLQPSHHPYTASFASVLRETHQ